MKTSVSHLRRKVSLAHFRAYGWWRLHMEDHEAGIVMLCRQALVKMPPNSTWSVTDLTQEVKRHIWEKANSYQPSLGAPTTWVWRVARNHLANLLKSEARSLKGMHRITDEEAQAAALDNYTGNSSAHPNYPPVEGVAFDALAHVSPLTKRYCSAILSSDHMVGSVTPREARRAAKEAQASLGLTPHQYQKCQMEIVKALMV